MTFPEQILDLVRWMDQPVPEFVGDTHVLTFRADPLAFGAERVISFVGQLYQPKGSPGGSPRFARLIGSGLTFWGFPSTYSGLTEEQLLRLSEDYGGGAQVTIDLSDSGLVFVQYTQLHPGDERRTIVTVESGVQRVTLSDHPGQPEQQTIIIDNWVLTLTPGTAAGWAWPPLSSF